MVKWMMAKQGRVGGHPSIMVLLEGRKREKRWGKEDEFMGELQLALAWVALPFSYTLLWLEGSHVQNNLVRLFLNSQFVFFRFFISLTLYIPKWWIMNKSDAINK